MIYVPIAEMMDWFRQMEINVYGRSQTRLDPFSYMAKYKLTPGCRKSQIISYVLPFYQHLMHHSYINFIEWTSIYSVSIYFKALSKSALFIMPDIVKPLVILISFKNWGYFSIILIKSSHYDLRANSRDDGLISSDGNQCIWALSNSVRPIFLYG